MSEQVFISYRRVGGDVTAKLICEALKNRGYTVFYDFDSLHGGHFDSRIMTAIEECNDFVLVLPQSSLDRCVNKDDWVRLEIRHALECKKHIVPVLMPGFSFPENLPSDISEVQRFDGVQFFMPYFDAVMDAIVSRLTSETSDRVIVQCQPSLNPIPSHSTGLEFTLNEGGNDYSVSQGVCHDVNVVIPESYKGKPVTKIKKEAFRSNAFIRSVFIPDSVTDIENRAFMDCLILTNVAVSRNLKSLGNGAFTGCCCLSNIALPQGITRIEDWSFYGCSSLAELRLPESVTTIGESAFAECSGLRSITLPDSLVVILKDAFGDCTRLENINIPASVVAIGENAFAQCTSLKTIRSASDTFRFARITFGENWAPEHVSVVNCSNKDYDIK
jgi:hypothetical protein